MALCSYCQTIDFRIVGYYRPELDYREDSDATDAGYPIDEDDEVRSDGTITHAVGDKEIDGDDHEDDADRLHPDEELSTASENSSEQGRPGDEYPSLREVLDRKDVCLFCNQISALFNTWSQRFWPSLTQHDLESGQASFSGHLFGVMDATAHTRHDDTFCLGNVQVTLNRCMDGANMHYQRTREHPPTVTDICDLLEVSNGSYAQGDPSVWLDLEPYYGRIRPPEIDFRLLREWNRICANVHGNLCGLTSIHTKRRPRMIRCIDVDAMCIVDLQNPEAKWVALSYVWGQREFKVLKGTSLESLRCPGALDPSWIPDTILDAITVTRMIGEKYLWTDSLCIIQDSPQDKATFIPLMDVIYGLATLTIVALSGEGAYDGLPGVRASSRPSAEGPFFVNGVWLQKAPPPDGLGFTPADRNRSKYMTRGWTFQEILLSRRLLIFTPEVVFWECQSATWREDANWEILDPVNRGLTLFRNSVFNFDHEGIHVPNADPESFNRMYQSLMSDYGNRELTYDGDALGAIEGILASIQLTSGFGFTWALPKSFLNHNVSSVRRRKATYTIATKHDTIQVPYPSWSWIGWIGPNLFDDLFGSLAGEHVGLEFYMLDSEKDRLVLIEQNQSFVKMESGNESHRMALHTWKENPIREVSMEHVPSSLLVPELRPVLLIFWTSCCTLLLDPTVARLNVRQKERERDDKGGRNEEGERCDGEYDEEYEDESEDEDEEVSNRVHLLRDHRGNTMTAVWDHPNHMATASDEAELIVVGRNSFGSRNELVAYMVEKQPSGARIRVGGAIVAEEEWNALAGRRWELVFLI
ncbi:heterokaryon incompatibility protein-domain-containing protein [Colletotrichum godetiae]|uniref:Heterokaryon incompatibility protein-domain-containing protein n=1 Tax=Colletotrichum godetiae TaxID=1209918 RepID=A0AAJ0ERI2_9PEZI|nr:heterokaryon incompatibility protein-domain-containing protein [Colletotrichum godetiae]KAK1672802.1 heterokaryon incompatibility protein-domain-containing protein [Colletotrichum godetiae]